MITKKFYIPLIFLLIFAFLGRTQTEDEKKAREKMREKVVLVNPTSEGGPNKEQKTKHFDEGSTEQEDKPKRDKVEPNQLIFDGDTGVEENLNKFLDEARKLLTKKELENDVQTELLNLANKLGLGIRHEDMTLINNELEDQLRELRENDDADLDWTDEELEFEIQRLIDKKGKADPAIYDRIQKIADILNDDVDENQNYATTVKDDDDDRSEPLTPEMEEANELFAKAESMIQRSKLGGAKILISQAYRHIDAAANLGHTKAKIMIAYAYLFGDYMPWNQEVAYQLFEELANKGIPEAQTALGFLHATGIGLMSGQNAHQGIALTYFIYGALGGDPLAQMAVGYRYWSGINLPSNCESALTWYRKVAKRVAREVRAGSSVSVQRTRLPDEMEITSANSATAQPLMDDNLLQYYRFLADKGDISAQVGLGQLYMMGGRGIEQNLQQAHHYFQEAAEQGSSNAFAYLGKMYLDGLSSTTPQNNQTAYAYFKKAADKANPIGLSGLGIMYLYGKGIEKNYRTALKYFQQAAEQGWVDGQLNLGHMYFNGLGVTRDYKLAIKYFQLASQNGHVLAFYNLAQIHAAGTGTIRSCQTAVELYKNVAERGRWSYRLTEAYQLFREGQHDRAAFKYLFLAELGFEIAQTNFAYLLHKNHVKMFKKDDMQRRALLYWTRSANQGYGLSRVQLGDYHYYGWGTDQDFEAAAHHYKLASEQSQNAQAMFNLAYMHEQGLGVKPDIHLAKRFYDMAAETSADAEIPVNLALLKLGLLFGWHYTKELPVVEAMRIIIHSYFGDDWDLFLVSSLIILLMTVIAARMRLMR